MKKFFRYFVIIIFSLYVIFCGLIYTYQESIIFIPEKLPKNFSYQFPEKFQEMNIETEDGKLLNGVLFKA